MSVQRIAIIGGTGQLGTALIHAFAQHEIVAPPHTEVALEDNAALGEFLDRTRPEVLINCAAFHNVDACERDAEQAFAINALAVDRAAAACASRGIAFATVSTDYVFDGTSGRAYREHDAPNPLTAYGASKLAGELLTRRHGSTHFIFRTSGVFGTTGTSGKGYTLIDKVLRQAETGQPTTMVADVTFSPSYAPHVAKAMRDVICAGTYGTYHVTNSGACTWYEFVRVAFDLAGLGDASLTPTTYAALGNPVRRPMYSPLESDRLSPAGIASLPDWHDAVREYLAARQSRLTRI